MTFQEVDSLPSWQFLPDDIILYVFSFLPASSVLRCSSVCRSWLRVAKDELLWKELFYRHWQIDRKIPMAQGKLSWLQEYKRLFYHTPAMKSEVLKQHHDQVLHVCFAHNGTMFATSSKDGFIRVWDAGYPCLLKYKEDMKKLTWKYTQFSQFNKSDTLLLVSGVHFGSNSTSGEIAVFTVQGEFQLQCRVINKPYDVFGTWYNDGYLISGQLYWTGQMQSCSALFQNQNASSLRTIMVADCVEDPDASSCAGTPTEDKKCKKAICSCFRQQNSNSQTCQKTNATSMENVKSQNSIAAKAKVGGKEEQPQKKLQSMQVYEDGAFRTKFLELDDGDEQQERLNGTIKYNQDYRDAESGILPYAAAPSETMCSGSVDSMMDVCTSMTAGQSTDVSKTPEIKLKKSITAKHDYGNSKVQKVEKMENKNHSDKDFDSAYCDEDACHSGMYLDGAIYGSPIQSGFYSCQDNHCNVHALNPLSPEYRTDDDGNYGIVDNAPVFPDSNTATSNCSSKSNKYLDKLLIFTMGSLTYTPHQIGIKKIEALEKIHGSETKIRLLPTVEDNLQGLGQETYDSIDHIIDMHGHIIGLSLSPDQRYLYVNSRPWPKDYVIENALYPPPIAQEIDIHVIDLSKMKEVGTMHRAHKAYTPNDECFFIFLDVCEEYVASGAEDKHGYVWDRHYGVCLNKFPHQDVVNSVAFNPKDSEMLVTVSDDYTVSIWRSRNREKLVKKCVMDNKACPMQE
ncbi:hypothetical protein KUTeg_022223 [Tegillarca granosa]|uniref:F-box domain-containing protein n=1 Tax=Tegillarca granosa TaxID=220873 RepID=A0ABQ9E8J0_TEGGR|nr:hypothetical protein KUTeg_022223 [Tegillarca granosa]